MNKIYLVSTVFLLFFIPSLALAQENDVANTIEELLKVRMLPIEGSPYSAEFIAVTKNNDDLVSVIYGDVYNYLPHPIFEKYLNKFPSNIITIDGEKYKKWSVLIVKTHEFEKAIHGSELKADVFKDQIVIMRAMHASIVVDENDTTDYYVKVLKRLN